MSLTSGLHVFSFPINSVVFPVPQLCEFLTMEKKQKVFLTCEQDEQGSKVKDFFEKFPEIFEEMKWQRKLRHQPTLYWFSSHMSLWSDISFNFAVLINILVAVFYPFNKGLKGKKKKICIYQQQDNQYC
jgi:inositol 1,4,5-triphosphate receptor type 1